MIITAIAVGGFLNFTFSSNGYSLLGWMIIIMIFLIIKNISIHNEGLKEEV